jgi:hypothetical protein
MQAVDRPAHPHRDRIAVTRKVDQFIRRQRLLIDAVNEHVQVVVTKQVITHPAAIQRRGHLGRNRQIVDHRNPIGSVLLEPEMPQALEHDLRYRRLIQRRLKGSVQAGHPLLLLQEHRRQLLHDVDEMNLPRHDEKRKAVGITEIPDILRQIMLGQIGANIHQNAAAIAQSERFHKVTQRDICFHEQPRGQDELSSAKE